MPSIAEQRGHARRRRAAAAPTTAPRSRWCPPRCRRGTAAPGPRRRCGAPSTARTRPSSSAWRPAARTRRRPRPGWRRAVRGRLRRGRPARTWSRQLEVAGRLGVVVETQHGRGGAAPQDAPAHLEPVGEGVEAVGAPPLGRRQRVQAQLGLGDHAQDPFGPHEQLGQVGPERGARPVPAGADHAAVGQGHLEARPPCPRSSRSGSSTGPRRDRPPSRPPSTGPWTGASARG